MVGSGRAPILFAALAVAGGLSACTTGSTSSFSQAPIFFSDGQGSVTDVAGLAPTGPATETGDFTTGVPSFSTVGGNSVLPVDTPAAEPPLPSTTLQSLAPSTLSPTAQVVPTGTPAPASAPPVPVGVGLQVGAQPGGLTPSVTSPAVSLGVAPQGTPGAVVVQVGTSAATAPLAAVATTVPAVTTPVTGAVSHLAAAATPVVTGLTAPAAAAAPATTALLAPASAVGAATAAVKPAVGAVSNALPTRGVALASAAPTFGATAPTTLSTANSLLTTAALQQARPRMCGPRKPAC